MTRNTKIFLGACLTSFALWFLVGTGISMLKDLFFWHELARLSADSSADALQKQLEEIRPTLKSGVAAPDIRAAAAFSFLVVPGREGQVLFAKNQDRALPIASLTKLMTALVSLESYGPEEQILVSAKALAEEGDQGKLLKGQTLSVQEMLYPLLLESSNDAATALAEHIGQEHFINRMNHRADTLKLTNTLFVNPNGLDPENPEKLPNLSSAKDLAELAVFIKREHPEVFKILVLPEFGPYVNTNEFVHSNGWRTKVLGGKTGQTDLAQGTLILLLQSPKNKGYTVNVILGTGDRFGEMRKLVDWTHDGYIW
ncbi:MAG: D-alanyl-D-alanine carboxypeptidase [Parcubacteria group bacterium]|nr:D-alanyl-D-alanine carboxypeptidase [Parcubacteria group bacterium]